MVGALKVMGFMSWGMVDVLKVARKRVALLVIITCCLTRTLFIYRDEYAVHSSKDSEVSVIYGATFACVVLRFLI